MTSTAVLLFEAEFQRQLAHRANHDAFVARHRTLANVSLGIRRSDGGGFLRIHVGADGITIDQRPEVAFTLVGDGKALQSLAEGFPFNRLVRQHRLNVEGDLRGCVQNWLLIYAILRLCNHPGA